MQESEVGLLPDTIYKNEIKMDGQCNCELKLLEGNIQTKTSWFWIRKWFLRYDSRNTSEEKLEKI